jgi:hypothetical protein
VRAPTIEPKTTGKIVEKTAMARSTRAAQIVRERMSRPKLSVPKGCCRLGACMIAVMSKASGS